MTNPDDAGAGRRRDGELALVEQAHARAAAAETAGDHATAQALRLAAAEHTRRAKTLDQQLRVEQARRRANLAITVRQHQAAAASDTEVSR